MLLNSDWLRVKFLGRTWYARATESERLRLLVNTPSGMKIERMSLIEALLKSAEIMQAQGRPDLAAEYIETAKKLDRQGVDP